MRDDTPKFRCAACQRGVLNRRVSHCLFCGAQLTAEVLASPEENALADAQARREQETYDLSAPPPPPDPHPADVLCAAADAAGLISSLF